MTVDIELQPLLDTLHKISAGRVLNAAMLSSEGDFSKAEVPVQEPNPGDKKDMTLRKYAKDWLRRQSNEIGIDVRFESLPPRTSFYDSKGREVPVMGVIVLSWWPRKETTELEELAEQQKKWKGTRPG